MADVPLTEERRDQLIKLTAFNLESRYPDEKRSFRKKRNEAFARKELDKIEEIFKWLKSML